MAGVVAFLALFLHRGTSANPRIQQKSDVSVYA